MILIQDLRFALRLLHKSPGFTLVAIVTLALAIGANAVVFSVLNGLILRPLNIPRPRVSSDSPASTINSATSRI